MKQICHMSDVSKVSCVGGTIFLAHHQQLNTFTFHSWVLTNLILGVTFFHQGARPQGFLANQQRLLLNFCFLDHVNVASQSLDILTLTRPNSKVQSFSNTQISFVAVWITYSCDVTNIAMSTCVPMIVSHWQEKKQEFPVIYCLPWQDKKHEIRWRQTCRNVSEQEFTCCVSSQHEDRRL